MLKNINLSVESVSELNWKMTYLEGILNRLLQKLCFLAFVKAQAPRCFTLNNQTKQDSSKYVAIWEHHCFWVLREGLKISHMLTHNVVSSPKYSLPVSPSTAPPICLSSLSHPLPIPLSSLSHLSLISLLSSLSSLVHNFTAVVRQSHSFHQRDQERVFLGRGLLCTAFPQRINHVQTLMPCYTKKGMR